MEVLFIINDITNWTCTAVAFAFERVFRQTARHLLGEIGGIILCKALQDGFQQDAVCAGRNHLGCGNDTDVVLLRESRTLTDLSFDGFLALVIGRIAGIDNGFHQYRLLMYE